jgi:hypothetical protein
MPNNLAWLLLPDAMAARPLGCRPRPKRVPEKLRSRLSGTEAAATCPDRCSAGRTGAARRAGPDFRVFTCRATAPGRQRLVRGENHRASVQVAVIDDLEEHVRSVRAVAEVADLVDHQDVGVTESSAT